MKFRTTLSLVLVSALVATVASAADGKKPEGCSGEGHGHRGEKMFARMDSNSDGVLTRSEFTGGAEKRFAHLDSNSDGSVTKEEFNQPRGPRGGHAKKGDGTEGEKQKGNRPAPSAEQIERWKAHHEARFAALDTNKSGKVEKAEMSAEALARFKEIDADKNGVLTKAELQKHHAERRGSHQKAAE